MRLDGHKKLILLMQHKVILFKGIIMRIMPEAEYIQNTKLFDVRIKLKCIKLSISLTQFVTIIRNNAYGRYKKR